MYVRILLPFLFVLFSISRMQGQGLVPGEYIGEWTGTVHQEGFSSYEVSVVIIQAKPGENGGKIHYTTLGCGGDLTYVGEGRDTAGIQYAEFREALLYGDGKCINDGTVLFFMHDNRLRFIWQHPDYPMSDAAAELTRL